jgi:hypothetical protein
MARSGSASRPLALALFALSIALSLPAAAPPAAAAPVTYPNDPGGFVAATGAASIGNLPAGVGPVASLGVGGVTITTASGSLYFGEFNSRVPNNEMIISGDEDFVVTIPGGVFAFGFDLYEPTFGGPTGCNTTCVNTSFTIEILAGTTSLGSYAYDAPNDTGSGPVNLGFFGVHSDVAFDRVVVNDVTGHSDNEMFANFLTGSVAVPTLGSTWGRLKTLYR